VAIFDDPLEWIGKPVVAGEKRNGCRL